MIAETDSGYREIFKKHEFFVNPERIDLDRLASRKSPGEGIQYGFVEEQDPQTHLFPTEEIACEDLLSTCESYLGRKDVFKIKIAMALSLYGHQRQFRKSGEPYMIHPFAMAKEAAEWYKADWQTIALCLLHDLLEDSPKYGHEVKAEWVAGIYKEIGYERDGQILGRSMEIMSKITDDVEADDLPKDVATLRKLYDVLLEVNPDNYETLRVLLVKLLDRKHNLQTIQYVPESKRKAVIDETFRVYVNMAGALHLYKLQDDLVAYAMMGRYPQMSELVSGLREAAEFVNQMESDTEYIAGIEELFMTDDNIKQWWPEQDCFIRLQIPSMYEVYLNSRERAHPSYSYYKLQIVIPEKDGENAHDWIEKVQSCFNVLQSQPGASVISTGPSRVTMASMGHEVQRELQATISVRGVVYRLEFIGRDHYISEQASILHLFSKTGEAEKNINELRQAAFSHIGEIQERYSAARDSGLLAPFFETVSGSNLVEWRGVTHRFPENASVLDVLYSVIGQEVFRIHSVRVRSNKGKDYILSRNLLSARLHTGDTIVEYLTIPFNTIVPDWLDYLSVESVKDAVRGRLEAISIESASMREMVEERGKRKLREIYEDVWKEMLAKDRKDGIEFKEYELTFKFLDEARIFELPDKKLLPAISAKFPNTGEFSFQLGLDRIGEDVLAKVREAYHFFRQNRIAIEIPAGKDVSPEKLQEIFKNRGVSLLDSRIVERDDGFIMFIWFSTEEFGGKNANDTFHKLKNLLEKLEIIVTGQKGKVLPFNIYLRSTDGKFRDILQKKGPALRMKIINN